MQIKTEAAKAHEIKNTAIAFGVYGSDDKRLGDVAVTNKGLVWSNPKSKSSKDVTVKWDDFIEWMQSQLQTKTKSAKTKAQPKSAMKAAAASAQPAKTTKPRGKAAANGAAAGTTAKTKAKSAANGTAVKATSARSATARKSPAKSASGSKAKTVAKATA